MLHLRTRVSPDLGDPLLITWILAWDVHAFGHGDLRHFFDANIFFPVERALAFSEHLLGALPLFAPVEILTGNAVVAYNVLFVLSFALSGFSMFCLVYYWTCAFWPALVAGVLFGFAPFRLGQISHLHLLNFFWAPLALLFLDRFLRTRRWVSLAAFAAFYWLQALSSVYLAHMVTVAVALYVGHYVVVVERALLRLSLLPQALAFLGASLAVLLPPHLPYLAVSQSWGVVRTLQETMFYTPDVVSYLWPPLLMNDLYRALFYLLQPGDTNEKLLFPGLVLPALALLGSFGVVERLPAARGRQLRQVFWLIATGAFLISLGPYLIAFGVRTGIPMPYLLLYHFVPGFAAMRVPGRFAVLVVFAASPLAALGAIRCCDAVARRLGSLARFAPSLTSAGLVVLFFVELGWKSFPLVPVSSGKQIPEVYRWLAAERPGPIVEVPFGLWDDHRYVYFSTVHWLPLVNGASGFFPPTYAEIKEALAELPAREAVEYAGALGIKAIVVHTGNFSPEQLTRWRDGETAKGGLGTLAVFGPDRIYSVPHSSVASSLGAEILTPSFLPAKKTTRLGLVIRGDKQLPWRHPGPQGYSTVVIRWTDSRTGRSLDNTGLVQLPLIVGRGESVDGSLEISSPETSGTYTVQVLIPSMGIAGTLRPVEVRETALPTSRDGRRNLNASYVRRPDVGPMIVSSAEVVHLEIIADNTGQALWLASAEGDRGVVGLGWRWLRGDQELEELSGRAPIRYDVFPGQSYRFRVAIEAPETPGTYTLELGLVSELVTWFSDVGAQPLRLTVSVKPTPGVVFAEVVERLRSPETGAPRLALSTIAPRYRAADVLPLTLTGSGSKQNRPWVVDAYLALEGPGGALWFHDGRRLVRHRGGPWTGLAKGVALGPGTISSLALSIPLRGRGPGTYTWYLLLTNVASDRVIADARASFDILPGP